MSAKAVNESLLRLVILDYPKLLLENATAYSVFSNMIQCRQHNFLSTSESFLVLDKHDMISTHLLIYDFSNPFERKPVAGVRIAYESRARQHHLRMPLEGILDYCPDDARNHYEDFHREKGPSVQLNTLYVSPEYSFSRSGLRLSEVLFFGLCTYLRRLGLNHFVTAPNDQLKTDRWVKMSGTWSRPTFTFNHPEVQAQHTLYLIDALNDHWLVECLQKFEHYWTTAFEFVPEQVSRLSYDELREDLVHSSTNTFVPLQKTS